MHARDRGPINHVTCEHADFFDRSFWSNLRRDVQPALHQNEGLCPFVFVFLADGGHVVSKWIVQTDEE